MGKTLTLNANHIFFRMTLTVDETYFPFELDFICFECGLKDLIRDFNEMHKNCNVLIYHIGEYSLQLFLRISQGYDGDVKPFLTELKSSIYIEVRQKLPSVTGLGEYDDIKIALFKRVDSSFCLNILRRLVQEDDQFFGAEDVEEFCFIHFTDVGQVFETSAVVDIQSVEGGEVEEDMNDIFGFISSVPESAGGCKTLSRINSLVGVAEFKKEMASVAAFARQSSKGRKSERVFPFHYLFTIKPGMGLTTVLTMMAELFYKHDLISTRTVIEYNGFINLNPSDSGSELFQKSEDGRIRVNKECGVLAVHISRLMDNPSFSLSRLLDLMWDERGRVLFVLVLDKKDNEASYLIKRIRSKVNCHQIDFPELSDPELIEVGRKLLEKRGYKLSRKGERALLNRVGEEKRKTSTVNIRTIQKLLEEAATEKFFKPNAESARNAKTITDEDFPAAISEKDVSNGDGWKMLNEIVGLETVKQRIREIIADVDMNRKFRDMGEEPEKSCYHMMFTGNPGTGKTTVARIVGKIFEEMGILRKGEFYEVSRDALVARYVGQTAPRVREKVREALGSVLFIDEAYSLYSGSDRQDYGYEAVDTLVKQMEDNRDDLVVIMAGYKDEMEQLIKMNSGLEERIPYKIDFPDYSAEELTTIFFKLLGKQYIVAEGVREEIAKLFAKICKHTTKNFGNGRLARNIAERLKIKHSIRVYEAKLSGREELLTITMDDVKALYRDEDFKKLLSNRDIQPRKIGFERVK